MNKQIITLMYIVAGTAFTVLSIVAAVTTNYNDKHKIPNYQSSPENFENNFDYFEYAKHKTNFDAVDVLVQITKEKGEFKYEYTFLNTSKNSVMIRCELLDSLYNQDKLLYLEPNEERKAVISSQFPPTFTTTSYVIYERESETESVGLMSKKFSGSQKIPVPSM